LPWTWKNRATGNRGKLVQAVERVAEKITNIQTWKYGRIEKTREKDILPYRVTAVQFMAARSTVIWVFSARGRIERNRHIETLPRRLHNGNLEKRRPAPKNKRDKMDQSTSDVNEWSRQIS
jgi:HAMP domain-containing protein